MVTEKQNITNLSGILTICDKNPFKGKIWYSKLYSQTGERLRKTHRCDNPQHFHCYRSYQFTKYAQHYNTNIFVSRNSSGKTEISELLTHLLICYNIIPILHGINHTLLWITDHYYQAHIMLITSTLT